MNPTDADLNRAMAEACGWKDIQDHAYTPSGIAVCGTVPDDRPSPWNNRRHYIPRYCTDRNTLPDVWQAAEAGRGKVLFLDTLKQTIRQQWGTDDAEFLWWRVHTAEPRLQVIAALKALAKWPEHWTEDE